MNFVQVLIDAASLGSLYALSALAIGLIFGIMRLINFAQGEYVTIGAYALIVPSSATAAQMFIGALPWPIMVALVICICICVSLAVERLAFRPLRQTDPATLLVASFAVSFFLQNAILLIYGGRPLSAGVLQELTRPVVLFDSVQVPIIQLVTAGVTIVLIIALALFLKKTAVGIQMRAVAEDFRMARLLGVRAQRIIAIAFAISGLLGGVVALLLVTQTGVLDYRMGVLLIVYAFFATVVGGMGSLVGAAVGGFLVGSLGVLLQAYLPTDLRPFRDAFLFAIVIVILLVRPQGLVAARSATERV